MYCRATSVGPCGLCWWGRAPNIKRCHVVKHGNTFPADVSSLKEFDLIVLGDVPALAFTEKEQQAIADFVAKRGGGLLLIDGRDNNLATFSNTPARTAVTRAAR